LQTSDQATTGNRIRKNADIILSLPMIKNYRSGEKFFGGIEKMTGISPYQERLNKWIKIPMTENIWIRNETKKKERRKRKTIGLAHNFVFSSVRESKFNCIQQ